MDLPRHLDGRGLKRGRAGNRLQGHIKRVLAPNRKQILERKLAVSQIGSQLEQGRGLHNWKVGGQQTRMRRGHDLHLDTALVERLAVVLNGEGHLRHIVIGTNHIGWWRARQRYRDREGLHRP